MQAAEHMRDTFERHGAAWFAPCPEAHAGPTFLAASPPREPPPQQQQQEQQQEQQEPQQPPEPQWQSQWAAAGWLVDNPLVRGFTSREGA